MLRGLDHILGYAVFTTDGALGSLQDLYYDDRSFTVRYLIVADVDEEGSARLVSPIAVERMTDEPQRIYLSLDRERLLGAPDIGRERPVSLQAEMDYHDHFGWPYYWQGAYAGFYPLGPQPIPASPAPVPPPASEGTEASHHLRSANETKGYHVQALDGEIGHIEDFVVDEHSWHIVTVVIDTRNWWSGKKVAMPAEEFTHVDWEAQLVSVAETREQVQQTREFDASVLMRSE
jgi:sporulation protein YlmC with PRC-barrel domain